MADWSLPTLSSLYSSFLSGISGRLDDAAKMFDSVSTSPSNLPAGTKRWNATGSKFEKWNGSAWSDLASTYDISISGTAATASGLSPGVALANIGSGGVTYSYLQNVSATKRLLGRNSAGSGVCQEVTLSQLLDWVGTTAQGDILYKGASGWARLGAGTVGQVLITGGSGANPSWGTPLIASSAEAIAGTENAKCLTPLRMKEGLNASGSAPMFACRAWVNFNGTGTVAIRASGNVSSITDNGVGDYTINFTTNMPDADYAVNASGYLTGLGNEGETTVRSHLSAPSSSSVRIANGVPGTNGSTAFSYRDSAYIDVLIFR